MLYEINMAPSALADIEEIFEWYNKEAIDLGYRFINYLDERLLDFSITPKSGSVRYDNVRCALLKVFPYLIHYEVDDSSQSITVYRIFPIRQKPLWEK